MTVGNPDLKNCHVVCKRDMRSHVQRGNEGSSLFSVGTQGYGGFIGRTVIMAVVGGTASVLGGGKFASGAMAGAFMYMFNDMANYILKQSRGRYSISDSMTDKGLVASGKSRALLALSTRDLADGCANASLVSGIASASIPIPYPRYVLAGTSSLFAGAATFFNDVSANEDMLGMTRDTFLSAMMPPGYMGTMTEELIKLYINIRGN